MPGSENIIWEIGDERDVAFLKKVGLEENCEVQAGKEEDPSTHPVTVGKERVLVYTFV